VDFKKISKQQLFENMYMSNKNNGANILLANRELALTQIISRVSDLEDLPMQMSSLFSVIRQGFNICCLRMLHQTLTEQVPQKIYNQLHQV
jgi:hypothetical protein